MSDLAFAAELTHCH